MLTHYSRGLCALTRTPQANALASCLSAPSRSANDCTTQATHDHRNITAQQASARLNTVVCMASTVRTCALPPCAAQCSAVSPSTSDMATSAPACSSCATTSAWPLRDASWSGDTWLLSPGDGNRRCANRYCAAQHLGGCPRCHAVSACTGMQWWGRRNVACL